MKTFIRAASCISPQESFNGGLFDDAPKEYSNNFLDVVEPAYKNIIDAKLLRRMSKVVRTGVATALKCLQDAGINNVDAIVSGTAYGCMEDSENFLKNIILQNEQLLSPTAFIQSTHNTVAAQIALILQCHQYNNTFVHRGFSFEHALIDAMLLLKEEQAETVLAGSADEMTELTFNILTRLGLYKRSAVSNLDLFNSNTRGSIAGQGSAFFLLSGKHTEPDIAKLDGLHIFYKPAIANEIQNDISQFLSSHQIKTNDIDLIITGMNGDSRHDKFYDSLGSTLFANLASINYKHLCGEYPTSSSFAMWLAANIIKQNKLPQIFERKEIDATNIKRILIYNNYQGTYHSLILLSSCE